MDFISSGGVVFGESSDDEDNGENDGSDEKSSNVSDGKRPDNGLKVEEMSAVESSESEDEKELSSTLYIQMEYCEKQVRDFQARRGGPQALLTRDRPYATSSMTVFTRKWTNAGGCFGRFWKALLIYTAHLLYIET